MAKSGSVRLNNNEFYQLIPNLKIDEALVIDVKVEENWMPLFVIDKNQKPAYILCNLCNQKIIPNEFTKHLQQKGHKTGLSKVKQFYQPFYTYAKNSEKLAKGYMVSEAELKDGIKKATEAMNSVDSSKLDRAKNIALYLNGDEPNEFIDIVTELALKRDAENPSKIFINVTLTLAEILQLEFSDKKDIWKPMLTTFIPNYLSANFTCVLCSKNLSGIITVNAHFNGYKHKLEQLATLGIRLRQRKNLTKNCSYQYGTEYSLVLKESGKSFFKKEALSIIRDKSKSKKDYKSDSVDDADSNFSQEKLLASRTNDDEENIEDALIGVEYVVKYIRSADSKAMYECCLCEFVFDEGSMQFHLIGYNHRLKYVEMHYPITTKKYKDKIGHIKFNEFRRVMTQVLAKLAIAIENYHGRALPFPVSEKEFARKRQEIVAHIYSLPHACEVSGPSFDRYVKMPDIIAMKQSDDHYVPNVSINDLYGRFATLNTGKIYLNERCYDPKFKNEFRARSPESPRPSRSRYEKYQKESRYRSRSPHRKEQELYKHNDLNDENIWKIYREEVSKAASKIELTFNEYRKNPESYPMYDTEWNRFWNRRKEELISQGIDHRSYNYQPDWVYFFKERLEQFFGEALHKSQVEVRMLLNIPLDAEEDSHSGALQYNTRSNRSYSKSFVPPTLISYPHLDMQQNDSKESQLDTEDDSGKQNEPIVDERPNVIHVLRLMTALEDHLGSLGGKIMDLLTKALILEKNCAGNTNELSEKILKADNCALLETAMEKLKGILFAGLLEKNKVQGFNKVINYTANLLEHANKMGWRKISDKSDNKELRNLLEVMQSKGADLTAQSQKSLSDTLMDLLSNQRKDKLDVTNNVDVSEYVNQRDNNFDINRSVNRPNSNINANVNLSSNRHKPNNNIPSLMSIDSNKAIVPQSTNITNMLKNGNNSTMSSYGLSSNVETSNNASGSGRNDYSNINYNNSNYMGGLSNPQNNNNKMFGNYGNNNSNSGNSKSNNNSTEGNYSYSNFGAQYANNMNPNLNMSSNLNRPAEYRPNPFSDGPGNNRNNTGSNFGNTSGNSNFKSQNMQWTNTRSNWQQYPINRGGKNM